MIARVLESVAIVVIFSGKPLGTVCRKMQKLFRQKTYLYADCVKDVNIFRY